MYWATEYLKSSHWAQNPYLLGTGTGLATGALVGALRDREDTGRTWYGDVGRAALGGAAVGLGGTAAGELTSLGLGSLSRKLAPKNELTHRLADVNGGILGGALGGYAATRLIDEPLNATTESSRSPQSEPSQSA